jgi:uncharacterized membrane protein YeaQ/YmgE (transglycosylase-associated protein family)
MTNIIAICSGCITGSALIALIDFGSTISTIFALSVALIGSIIIFITDLR